MRGEDLYRIRWADGWRTLVYLYSNPHDTAKIARVIEALQGRSTLRLLARLRRRSRGRALLARQPSLRAALADRAWLTALPEGSLGRAYLEYCRGERLETAITAYVDEGTTPERNARLAPEEAFIQDFLFHSHDLYHLVTGYKTDLLGEISLLAFTAPQTWNSGVFAMAILGFYSIRLPRLRGQRMMATAFARALKARWLPEQDWVALLPQPLDEVRRQLRLYPPPAYAPLYVGRGRSRRRRPGHHAVPASTPAVEHRA